MSRVGVDAPLVVGLLGGGHEDLVGAKAANLRWLAGRGWPVPAGAVITYAAEGTLNGGVAGRTSVRNALARLLRPGTGHAVRSSANVEDGGDLSFAGQFTTVLGVRGMDAVMAAAASVQRSSKSPTVAAYADESGVDVEQIRMAVIVQEMVEPVISGVAFSRNPLTGLDEVVVEAVRGSGEALVQEGVTPERWVDKWGEFVARPESSDLGVELIEQVVRDTRRIADQRGTPVDLEWVYDGERISWVQLRDITGMGPPAIYSNRIAKEVLPGLIKPLVWSVNVPLVNGAWVELFDEMVGPTGIDPHDLAKPFHYRAYFNMGAIGTIFERLGFPPDSLELLLGLQGGEDRPAFRPSWRVARHLPRFARMVAAKSRLSAEVDAFVPAAHAAYAALPTSELASLSDGELLGLLDRLFEQNRRTASMNIVVPLLMNVYDGLLRRGLERRGIDYATVGVVQGLEELADYDPNIHLADLGAHLADLPEEVRRRVIEGGAAALAEEPDGAVLGAALDRFLELFGHLSESGNDFSATPWREQPDLVLRMAAEQVEGPADRDREGTQPVPLQLDRAGDLALRFVYARARRSRLHREAVSSLYTRGMGLFRLYYLELGRRLEQQGVLAAAADVFYLTDEEARSALAGEAGDSAVERVAGRRAEMERAEEYVLPEVVYGDEVAPLQVGEFETLVGIPTSRGVFTGKAVVVRSVADFDSMIPGAVLVVPYSDVAWTPLFARAGAVVAESGGILSHSSIVAREYAIPCVVSAHGACSLASGTVLTVDGYQGRVTIHEHGG